MNKSFVGLYTALVTPFNKDKSINYTTLERLINYQIASGVNGIVILGTTGEGSVINKEESIRIIKVAVRTVNSKIKVIMCINNNNIQDSVTQSKKAQDLGVDAILSLTPYYSKPPQNGIYQYFVKLADSIDIPIILYNVQSRTNVNLTSDTTIRLSKHKKIIGIKEASGDIIQIMDVIQNADKDFIILSGEDILTYPLICLGSHGVISVVSNIFPIEMKNIVSAYNSNNFSIAKTIHYNMRDLMSVLMSISSNPIPIKTLLAIKGIIEEQFRLPLCNIEKYKRDKLARIYNKYLLTNV